VCGDLSESTFGGTSDSADNFEGNFAGDFCRDVPGHESEGDCARELAEGDLVSERLLGNFGESGGDGDAADASERDWDAVDDTAHDDVAGAAAFGGDDSNGGVASDCERLCVGDCNRRDGADGNAKWARDSPILLFCPMNPSSTTSSCCSESLSSSDMYRSASAGPSSSTSSPKCLLHNLGEGDGE